ncbi:MAG: response regulator [Eubacteriales bacterium]|jgi:two-component system response regulator VicR|nr:response regulator [Eubacteriales bacterium]MDD3611523.1 response regulator [Eubacteriales bacterium]
MSSKILVVDDEQNIVDILKSNLEREGYEVLVAFDGEQAVEMCKTKGPDLVLLDCMMPGMDGFDVCKTIRRNSNVPIVMLTAKSEELDKVLGLELGADDYITKPFSVREVLARVKAQLRRVNIQEREMQIKDEVVISIGDIMIDKDAYQVYGAGKPLELTLREYELVLFLAEHAGQVFTREELLNHVWDYEYFGDARTVDVTVRRAREKIEPDQDNFQYILTKRGVGYYFAKEVETSLD